MALWTPADMTTAQWFDAADSSTLFNAISGGSTPAEAGQVGRWVDKSGNTRNATSPSLIAFTSTRRIGVLNGLDVVRFTGQGLVHTYANNGADCSVFIVGRRTGSNSFSYFYQASAANQPVTSFVFARYTGENWASFVGATFCDSGVNVLNRFTLMESFCTSAGALDLRTDGGGATSFSGTVYAGDSSERRVIGGYLAGAQNDVLVGDVGEIVVFGSIVSTDNRQRVEGYLAHKWGLTANLPSDHPYKNAAPTTGSQSRRRRSLGGFGI